MDRKGESLCLGGPSCGPSVPAPPSLSPGGSIWLLVFIGISRLVRARAASRGDRRLVRTSLPGFQLGRIPVDLSPRLRVGWTEARWSSAKLKGTRVRPGCSSLAWDSVSSFTQAQACIPGFGGGGSFKSDWLMRIAGGGRYKYKYYHSPPSHHPPPSDC